MTKVKGIEIENPPYSDEYLDDCIKKVDLVVEFNYLATDNLVDIFKRAFDEVEKLNHKIIYIHNYPKDLIALIGIKKVI